MSPITHASGSFVTIRPLSGNDSVAYFALRQHIRDIGEHRYFSDSYTRESVLDSEELKRGWCEEKPSHCIMGAFANDRLIGAMMITRQGGPDSPVVVWEATWLDPAFRQSGVASAAYRSVRKWSEDRGYRYAAASIRDDNQKSQEIRRSQGFSYAYTDSDEIWANGEKADAHTFLLDLQVPLDNRRDVHTLRYFKDAIPFLYAESHGAIDERIGTIDSMPNHLVVSMRQVILG